MLYISWIVGAVTSVTVRQSLTLPNGRDLGGTPLPNGRVVAHNRLLRSATPADASPAVVDELIRPSHGGLGLRTVIDLRSQREGDKDEGSCLLHAAHGAPTLKHLPMLDEQMLRDGLKRKVLRQPLLLLTLLPVMLLRLAPSRRLRARGRRARDHMLARLLETTSLDELYALILRQRGAELKRLVVTLTQPGALPALVHCTHGKVRHHCSLHRSARRSMKHPHPLARPGPHRRGRRHVPAHLRREPRPHRCRLRRQPHVGLLRAGASRHGAAAA